MGPRTSQWIPAWTEDNIEKTRHWPCHNELTPWYCSLPIISYHSWMIWKGRGDHLAERRLNPSSFIDKERKEPRPMNRSSPSFKRLHWMLTKDEHITQMSAMQWGEKQFMLKDALGLSLLYRKDIGYKILSSYIPPNAWFSREVHIFLNITIAHLVLSETWQISQGYPPFD